MIWSGFFLRQNWSVSQELAAEPVDGDDITKTPQRIILIVISY